jgi:hypothetical protein
VPATPSAPHPAPLRRARPRPVVGLVVGLASSLACNLTGFDTAENGGDYICDAYLAGDAEASDCVAELNCGQHTDATACADAPVFTDDDGRSVTCRWGDRFVGEYDGEAMMCLGEAAEVCVAALLLNEGDPPCAGAYAEVDAGVEVLHLGCAEPLAPAYNDCAGSPYEETACTCVSG